MFGEKKHGSLGAMRSADVAAFVKGRKKETWVMSQPFVQDGGQWLIYGGGCQGSCSLYMRSCIRGSAIQVGDALDVADIPDGLSWEY